MPTDSLTELARAIAQGLPGPSGGLRGHVDALFGDRYQKRYHSPTAVRDAYALADGDEGVPYAGIINPDNPPSGPYGGTSVVWFPSRDSGSLIDFGIGTRGLAPDEGILTRPGHKRRITALRRYLARLGVDTWVKHDPSALGTTVPKTARDKYPGFEHVFKRYGAELYACAVVPRNIEAARAVVQAFLDLYAFERGWQIMKARETEYDTFHAKLREDIFAVPTIEEAHQLLRNRRFVVLQGPPGTGKTRMADEIRRRFFDGRGLTVQFHPAVTYEDFVVGLSPDAHERTLRFDVRAGWLVEAARASKEAPFLLVIDEINRADLGRVLGEAIYLFEASEVGGARARRVRLPHAVHGETELFLPTNLYVLATMNTADRSIASMDLAVRRRFAFVTLPPERAAVAARGVQAATAAFDQVAEVFVEHAPGETLHLMPGHAYFLVKDEPELRDRLRFEIIPLLDEYLQQSRRGCSRVPCSRDWPTYWTPSAADTTRRKRFSVSHADASSGIVTFPSRSRVGDGQLCRVATQSSRPIPSFVGWHGGGSKGCARSWRPWVGEIPSRASWCHWQTIFFFASATFSPTCRGVPSSIASAR